MPLSYCLFLFFLAFSLLVSSSSELLSDSSSSLLLSSDSFYSSLNSFERLSNSFSVILGSTSGGYCFLRTEGSEISTSSISFSDSEGDFSYSIGVASTSLMLDFDSSLPEVGIVEVKLITGPPTSMAPDFIFLFCKLLSSLRLILLSLSTMRL
jgi:hypothetical protein